MAQLRAISPFKIASRMLVAQLQERAEQGMKRGGEVGTCGGTHETAVTTTRTTVLATSPLVLRPTTAETCTGPALLATETPEAKKHQGECGEGQLY